MIKRFLIIIMLCVAMGCGNVSAPIDCDSMRSPNWAKVNTHVHTYLSDGVASPEYVIQWYKDNCYDALAITDHNLWYVGPDADIVIITGNEESRPRHYTSLNYGEVEILNHPNLFYHFTMDEVLSLTDVMFFEVYNAHPKASNEGDAEHPSTEVIWDAILESGRLIYGVAADDAHFKHGIAGTAWIMVRADKTQADILEAINSGDFYASTGVYLSEYSAGDDYIMSVDYDKTAGTCNFELIEAGDYKRGRMVCVKPDGAKIYAWGQPVMKVEVE